jgi:hypothetical protein
MKQFIVFWISFLLFAAHAQASSTDLDEILDQAERLGLAHHPTWLQLLHYERGSKRSTVLTDNFFLSPEGKTNPHAELLATIKAYFAPWGENVNEHARCRFPARYFWLSQQLSLPGYNLRDPKCQKLEKWALFDTVKSVSLFLVSGYFGNPASTFGHALIKFNTESPDDHGLFDLTLNYGAMVPKNENVLRYVVQGLFGGYEAGFSDKYFYTQDLVYSRTEFRDIWDYRLALSDDQRTLLILHIWEIVGQKFNYYFLEKNCAYRLAELADLAIEEDILTHSHPWYIPEEMFHRLNDIDRARRESGGTPLIESVHYIPSSQRELHHRLKLLSPYELEVFNAILLEGINSLSIHLEKLTVDQKILVLDSLLAYQQYRLIAEGADSSHERRKAKDQILLARLRLPAHPVPPLEIRDLPSPADGTRSMEVGAGIAVESNKESFLRLHWSPFKKELVGQNSLEGDELVVLDLTAGIFRDGSRVFADRFDLIRILNLNTLSVKIGDENQWSWRLRVGMDRIEGNEGDEYDGIVSFGAGRAWKWNEPITGYGMVDLAAHTIDPYIRLRPHLGLKFDLGVIQTWLYFGMESVNYRAKFSEVWGGKMQCRLNERSAVHIEYSNENATLLSAGINWYF